VPAHRTRRLLAVLGACALPVVLFAGGYAITGAGAAPGVRSQAAAGAPTSGSTAASGDAAIAMQKDFYAKLPDRIGIVDDAGRPVGWADKAALEPPAATGPFDPGVEDAWYDTLVPVHDDQGVLVGYYLLGYGYVDRATAASPSFDRDALRSQRAATAPFPPGAGGAAPATGP
jgi:hypothetical protein